VKYFLTILMILFIFTGCSTKIIDTRLNDSVATKSFVNHFPGDVLTIETSPDTEEVLVLLPKSDLKVRIKMNITNLEDVLYIKLVDESGFNIDKILRRVNREQIDMNSDAYMVDQKDEKDIVTVQIYVPHIYLYNNKYRPKLLYSYKRNGRSIQEEIKLNFLYKNYHVVQMDDLEITTYSNVKEFCKAENEIEPKFKEDINRLSKHRDLEDIKSELQALCQE